MFQRRHLWLGLAHGLLLFVLTATDVTAQSTTGSIIGTVSGAEFIVSVSASVGFLLALGSEAIRWDIALMLLIGGSIAAPVSAWLVRQFSDRALGTAVGLLIILLNIDRLMLLVGIDAGVVTTVRLVVITAAPAGTYSRARGKRELNRSATMLHAIAPTPPSSTTTPVFRPAASGARP